ncbi:MerR family transcriptional regulator [Lysinibacillus sp. NPDC097214]|uniref:MerR family transcriptional regulator n=1 Tax=Lysinibacillus sp. NPDC097214 TaxID=3390584 RepID=UPI003D08D567
MTTDNDRLTAKEVANTLGFSTTNLKHYAALLEQNGLQLYRNTRNHREYSQTDVNILRAMQHLNREKSMPLEEAASFVMSSDIDISAILAPKISQVVATNDANIPVVQQDNDNAERVVAQALAVIDALRGELHDRDKLMIEFQSAIDDKLQRQSEKLEEQTKQIAEQSETIAKLSEQIVEMERKQLEKPAPSFWSRLFGK